MTGTPDTAERGHATAEPRGRPTLEPDESLWLENYLERLKKASGGLLKRLVVYGSKARGDAGPTSDVDVLVLVGDPPDAVRIAWGLIYDYDDPDDVDHDVVIRTEADCLQDVDNELSFARNVEAEGVQIHPVYRPARRLLGDRRPVTRKGIRHALPIWLAAAQSDLKALRSEIDLLKDGRLKVPGIAARPAFDAVFFSTMAWLYGKLFVALLVEKLIHHARAISPGATTYRCRRPRSAWRDFKFVFNQVTRAIEPPLSLARMIGDWRTISGELAEPPRRRQPQLSAYFGWVDPLEDQVASTS